FNNTAVAFNIASYDDSTLSVRGGGIMNNSSNTQTFGVDVIGKSASQTWNAAAGGLSFANVIVSVNPGGDGVHIKGAFPTTISGVVSVAQTLFLDGSAAVTLTGTQATSTGPILAGGTLLLNRSAGGGAVSNLEVTGTVRLLQAGQFSAATHLAVYQD